MSLTTHSTWGRTPVMVPQPCSRLLHHPGSPSPSGQASPRPWKTRKRIQAPTAGELFFVAGGIQGGRCRAVLVRCARSAPQLPELEGVRRLGAQSRRMDSVTWQEGKGPVRGRVQSFWGSEAALLLVCPGEGLSEHKSRRPRIIRCLMTHNKGVSFSLAASMDASPALCAPSMGWDMPWILMLLLTIGQGVIILALSIVLWRQRVCGAPGRGNRMRCYNCGGSPSSSCKEAVTTCGEGRPQPGLEQIKLPGNPPVTLIHQHPACVTAHHCNQVETESVGDVTYPAHRDCYLGDLCNSAVASHVVPACILAAAATALTCLLPGLWSG
ncbi:uncharacterized protein LOC111523920 isoform X4 [Piliocolobus tephrosceles]|nr:uncharacterized protein LOC111523920 isoform X4 [Piliocolobus tephrosceles]